MIIKFYRQDFKNIKYEFSFMLTKDVISSETIYTIAHTTANIKGIPVGHLELYYNSKYVIPRYSKIDIKNDKVFICPARFSKGGLKYSKWKQVHNIICFSI